MEDVNKEKETPAESSPDKTTEETVTEDEKMSKEEPMIPKKRFDEINAKLKETKAKADSLTEKAPPKAEVKEESKSLDDATNKRLDAMEAAQAGHSTKVIEEAFIYAEGKGISLKEALETPTIKAYADVVKSEEALEAATPEGGRSPKTTPEKPLEEMSEAEHKQYFKKVVAEHTKGR